MVGTASRSRAPTAERRRLIPVGEGERRRSPYSRRAPENRNRSLPPPAARARRTGADSRARAACGARHCALRRASSAASTSRSSRRSRTESRMRSPVAHERERSADRRFGRYVQHDRAVRGAAHARVGDAHHVLYAGARELRRDRQVAGFGHAVAALRSRSSACTRKSSGATSSAGSSMRAARSAGDANTTARPAALEESRVGGGALEDRAVRRERCRTARPGRRPDGTGAASVRIDLAIDPIGRRREALAQASRRSTVRQSRCEQRLAARAARRSCRPRRRNPPCNARRSA